MSRFQALTNPMLDAELQAIREGLGLRENQKLELLRELSSLATWVLAQHRAGRQVVASGPEGASELLSHPLVQVHHIVLTEAEAEGLARLMERGEVPEPLRGRLRERLNAPPPTLRWTE